MPTLECGGVRWRFAVALCGLVLSAAPRFESAGVCSLCHSRIPDPGAGRQNVAPHALWRGSMKANSARDPYWKAKVREEAALNPSAAAIIEDTCLSCHAPMQQYEYRGRRTRMRLANLDSNGEEGVTCTVCHQIQSVGLGRKSSFTAGFVIGSDDRIFGPHADPFAMPMMHHTGYIPTQSKHVLDSSLCGSCHTVITPTLDADGRIAGEFVEQAPYLEWLASAYASEGRACQSCHMPVLDEPSYIAHRPPGGPFPPTSPRSPFGRHSFAGANVRGAAMLAALLPGQADVLQLAGARAADMLSRAVSLKLASKRGQDGAEVAVEVRNLTGHKLPTAYPSRRIWLHLTALDAQGRTVFESGAPGTPIVDQPHYRRISSARQTMVYEAEHADLSGGPTHSLLRAAAYRKDNRILPRGFVSETRLPDAMPASSIAPVGVGADPDFLPGSDRVIYQIPASAVRVAVEALYQSIKPDHAAGPSAGDNSDAKRFGELYRRNGDPVVMTKVELDVAR